MQNFSKVILCLSLYIVLSFLLFLASFFQFNVNNEFQFWSLLFIAFGITVSYGCLVYAISSLKEPAIKKIPYFYIGIFFVVLYFFMPFPKYIANDLLIYFFHAKMYVASEFLPYFYLPMELSSDAAFPYVATWSRQFFNYGLLWYGISLLGPILAKNIIWAGFVYKAISLVFYLASLFALFLLTDKNKIAVFLAAINPAVLSWGITGGHNDIVMLFFVLASLYFFSKEKYAFSFVTLALGALIKYAAFLFLPAFAIFLWKKKGVIPAIFLSLFSVLIFYLPYFFLGIGFQKLLGATTLSNPRLSGPLFSAMYFFKTGSLEYDANFSQFSYILFSFGILFFIIILSLLFEKKSYETQNLSRALFWSGVVFLILTFWFQSWYMVWILPFYFLSYQSSGRFLFFFISLVFYSLSFYIFSYTFSSALGALLIFMLFGFLKYFSRARSELKIL